MVCEAVKKKEEIGFWKKERPKTFGAIAGAAGYRVAQTMKDIPGDFPKSKLGKSKRMIKYSKSGKKIPVAVGAALGTAMYLKSKKKLKKQQEEK